MKVAKFNSDQEAMNAGYTEPLGNGEYARSQGRCETTLTKRFEHFDCQCGTYEENLGPCKSFLPGANPDRCVYCDHNAECHALTAALGK